MNSYLRWAGVGILAGGCLALAQGADQTPPRLLSATPPSPSSSVATNQAVSFWFSEPMNSALQWMDVRFVQASPPPQSLGFQAEWSVDQRTLTCRPLPAWPSGATVSWRLGTNFIDRAGNRMTNIVFGGFDTVLPGTELPPAGTNALTRHSVLRLNQYLQIAADTVVPESGAGAWFIASTVLASDRTAAAVRLMTPPGVVLDLARDPVASERFEHFAEADSTDGLDVEYPWGNYRFEVLAAVSSGPRFVLLLPTEPPAPVLSGFADLDRVDPGQPLTLAWSPWVGAGETDAIRVEVGNGLVQSPAPGEPGALTGTATEWVLPAGVLAYRSNYTASVSFQTRRVATDVAAREETVAERASRTVFPLRTRTDPADAPVLSRVLKRAPGLQMDIAGPSQRSVVVEANPGLSADGWSAVLSTNTGTGTVTVIVPAGSSERVFVRAWIP